MAQSGPIAFKTADTFLVAEALLGKGRSMAWEG
jgi:hypothetical protein